VTTVARRLAIVLVALATAACALTDTGDPKVAAMVGDADIPTSVVEENFDLRRSSQMFQQQAQQDAAGRLSFEAQAQIVTAMVRSEILHQVAERHDVGVSDADVDAAVEQVTDQVGGREELVRRLDEQGYSEELFLQQMRDEQVRLALQERAGGESQFADFLRKELADVPIEINPRYGEWDATSLQVRPINPIAPAGEEASPASAP
jgi:hypothetical protein